MDKETIITLAADIVSAHVSNNAVATDDIATLIEAVYAALASAGSPTEEVKEQEPAVSIRSSVRRSAITCLECGKKMKMLKRHLSTDHDLSPADYRAKWGLAADYPLVAPEYAARRAELAKQIGLGRKPGTGRQSKAARKPRASTTTANSAQPAST